MANDVVDLQNPSDSPLYNLTDKQRAFTEHYCATGGRNATESARKAGYAEIGAGSAASACLRNSKVLAAIKWISERKHGAAVALATDLLVDYIRGETEVTDPETGKIMMVPLVIPASERRKAAERILDFSGLMAIRTSKLEVDVSDHRDVKQIRANIEDLLNQIGGPQVQMLRDRVEKIMLPAKDPPVEDAEFEEIEDFIIE